MTKYKNDTLDIPYRNMDLDMDTFSLMGQALGQSLSLDLSCTDSCPSCKSTNLVQTSETQICQDCGTDLGGLIDCKQEWTSDANGDRSRCGMTINEWFFESSYGTGISFNNISSPAYRNIQRNIVWSSMPPSEKSLKNRLDNIQLNCRDANIPQSIIDYAQTLYYKVFQAYEDNPSFRVKRGKNNEGLQAAALFFAFQEAGMHKTYKEITSIFRIETKYLSDGIKIFNALVNHNKAKITIYSDYIIDFCKKLGLNEHIQALVSEVADRAVEIGILENNTPKSIVAGCIYYVIIEQALPLRKNIISEKL